MDPLINAHEVSPGFFVLGTPLAPISIRDQMIRGRWLVERLVNQNRVLSFRADGPTSKHAVFIVGAGVAGVSAAITAAEKLVNVVVAEKDQAAFGRQGTSTTRWIDPMQYDWPATSWEGTSYPPKGKTELGFQANFASNLATLWRFKWDTLVRRHPKILIPRYGAKVKTITALPSNLFEIVLSDDPKPFQAQAVIWAAGFGLERVTLKDERLPKHQQVEKARSAPFWGTDKLQLPRFGLRIPDPHLAILGGGDGAIQDALRALTKQKSAREIIEKIPLPAGIERDIQEFEETMHRHWVWAEIGTRDHDILEELDHFHLKQVAKALADPKVRAAVVEQIPYPKEEVSILFRCSHLVCYYALNRFLAHLFDQVIHDRFRRRLLVPDSSVIDVSKPDGVYELTVVPHTDCTAPVNVKAKPRTLKVHDIVVRHGIDNITARAPKPFDVKVPRCRHSLPNCATHR